MHDQTRQKKFGLKPRELEIISAVVAGHSNKEIAEHFKISEDTAKHHLSNIFDNLGISTIKFFKIRFLQILVACDRGEDLLQRSLRSFAILMLVVLVPVIVQTAAGDKS